MESQTIEHALQLVCEVSHSMYANYDECDMSDFNKLKQVETILATAGRLIDNQARIWSNCETDVAEKRAAIKTGITHIRRIDEKGIEHIGLVHSFDYSDDEMVLVTDIKPPMTEFHKWDLIHSDIDMLDG